MQEQKKTKRRGAVSLEECKGPPQQLYKPGLKYLTIGDGDLSFSLSIIKWLSYKQPNNHSTFLTVTSYDTKDQLSDMYRHTFGNILMQLQKHKNVQVFYQVDVNHLETYYEQLINNPLLLEGYDRIIWNFPHAGFPQQQKGQHTGPGFQWEEIFQQRHTNVINNFFLKGVKYLKKDGLLIMTHKTVKPFGLWNIPQIGIKAGCKLQKTIDFNIDDYPGYQNRRGAGKCGGKRFPCEDAQTYVFSTSLDIDKQNDKHQTLVK